jgi:hypothetical protein
MRNLIVAVQTSRLFRAGRSIMMSGIPRREEHPASATVQKRHYNDGPHGKLTKLHQTSVSLLFRLLCSTESQLLSTRIIFIPNHMPSCLNLQRHPLCKLSQQR